MKRVLITGAHGFLGKVVAAEIERNCKTLECVHTFRSSQYDLRDRKAVQQLLADKPADTIIHLAAVVGGIGANQKNPGKFFYDNLMMGVELIEQSRLSNVQKFVMIGTICSYPKFTPVPFKEEDFWNGYPEETNAPYGIAKKALHVQLQAYRQQYGFNGITLLPVNLYGPRDNFDLESSHVIPAMLRKFHAAKVRGEKEVILWGDGTPSREFLYVDDAAVAIRLAAERYDGSAPVNLGSGAEITMMKLAVIIKRIVGYEGDIVWDAFRPNGQPRRCLDTTRAQAFGFKANITLPMGLEMTYDWYLQNVDEIEGAALTQEERTVH